VISRLSHHAGLNNGLGELLNEEWDAIGPINDLIQDFLCQAIATDHTMIMSARCRGDSRLRVTNET